jgi:hypothetical protein
MSGPRADWFIGQLNTDELDIDNPFDAPVEEIGEAIDLTDRSDVLHARVGQLLARENFLFNKGVTCAIKDSDETSCHACPVSEAKNLSCRLGALCRLGREQEEVLTELVALRVKRGPPE